jgi:hypothetical protein
VPVAGLDDDRLLAALDAAVIEQFGMLRRTVQKNLAVLTLAFLRLLGAARGGAGRLSLAALGRVLPTLGTPHAREKRLARVLANPRLDPRGVTDGLARVIAGRRRAGLWPLLFDQTAAGSTQALIAGVPFAGRVLPLAVYTFDYPWQEMIAPSQNALEELFLLDVETALPRGVRPVWIGDRAYGRAALLRASAVQRRLYVLRGRAGTSVTWQDRHLKLGELPVVPGRAVRYRQVTYQARTQVPIDVVVFHDPTFADPWYLLVPPACEAILPTRTVVRLYQERMQVEQAFRDFKTHLGLRGLQLKVRVAERLGRLLLAFCLAYGLAVVLGDSATGRQTRPALEIPRRRARHGTRRTLSVLSIVMLMLMHPQWRRLAQHRLLTLVGHLARGQPLLHRPPPLPSRA